MFEFAVFWLGLLHGDQRPPGLALFLFGVECEFLQLVKGADNVSAEHMLARSLTRARRAQVLGNFRLCHITSKVKEKEAKSDVLVAMFRYSVCVIKTQGGSKDHMVFIILFIKFPTEL